MSQLKLSSLANQAGTEETPIDDVIHGSARAWVNFNGTGTVAIRASYNVSSITDNGTGNYTVNFTTAMPDVDYAVVFTSASLDGAGGYGLNVAVSTTSVGVNTRNGANSQTDRSGVSVAIFR